jgi:glycosyltransferase involved in cell wall biosynthesis
VRIGAVFNSDLTDVHHRVVVPLRELSRRGHEVVYVQPDVSGHVAPERLVGCDVVHVHRRAEQDVVACADTLLDHGIPVTWDTDDPAAFMPADGPRFAPAPNGHRRERELRCELAMLARASVVTTTSEALAARCRTFRDHDVVVIEDYLADEEYVFQPRAHSGVVIGWVGEPEQRADADWTGLTDSLRRVMERDCRVRVVTVGVRLDLDPERTTHHRHVPFERLAELIRQFDIGLAPRAELPASVARSRTTVKQYAASGVPWVASARAPYLGLGEAEGGLLVSDDGWEHALLALADARFRRRQLRRRAEEWGKAQHIAVHADQWESVFRTAASAVHQAA